jgi:hypothetical protein
LPSTLICGVINPAKKKPLLVELSLKRDGVLVAQASQNFYFCTYNSWFLTQPKMAQNKVQNWFKTSGAEVTRSVWLLPGEIYSRVGRHPIVGTPENMIDKLAKISAAGIEGIICWFSTVRGIEALECRDTTTQAGRAGSQAHPGRKAANFIIPVTEERSKWNSI